MLSLTDQQKETITPELRSIIKAYEALVKKIDIQAVNDQQRAYGGIIRAGKGQLVERMTEQLVRIAWCRILLQSEIRLHIDRRKMPIRIADTYIDRVQHPAIKEYLQNNKSRFHYNFGTDVQVYVDGTLVLPIECKAYTENAMLKRILFDASLMKEAVGLNRYYLVQLESQLGGDYSLLNDITYGSPASHVLMSHMDVDLDIITLLKGERDVNRPIHKPEFFKPLDIRELQKAVAVFAMALEPYKK